MSDSFQQLKSSAPAPVRKASGVPTPPRRLFTRVVVPGALVLAALAVLGWAACDWLRPTVAVKVEPVLVRSGGGAETPAVGRGEAVAKAAGWLEPAPYPVYAAALAPGTIDKILVLDGQKVEAGAPVAELVKVDAEIALRQAQAQEAGAKGKAAMAVAQIAEAQAKEAQLPAEVAALGAEAAALRDRANRLEAARQSGAVVEAEAVQQRLLADAKDKALEALRADAPARAARTNGAKAAAAGAAAEEAGARAAAEAANLRLARMTIRAPSAGVVMRLLKSPGDSVEMESIMPRSAQILALYDPKKLQMRVDVPLSLAARVKVGQACAVVADVLPERTFAGRVDRFVHEADLQKNTVQVKVVLEDPAPELKPEMLATAQFFSGGGNPGTAGLQARSDSPPSASQIFIKPEWLTQRHETHGVAWVARPAQGGLAVAAETALQLGAMSADGFIRVEKGLSPGDRVVVGPWDKLKDGTRLKVTQ